MIVTVTTMLSLTMAAALPPQARTQDRTAATIEQIDATEQHRTVLRSVPKPRGPIRPEQLTPDRHMAAAASVRGPDDAPSSPLDGRFVATDPLGGRDRCDPVQPEARGAACARVIERRAAQFSAPAPAKLSAEQRLLIDQRLRDLPATIESVTRPATSRLVDADAAEVQSVASVVLAGTDAPADPSSAKALVPDAAEVLQVLLQSGGAPQ